MRNIVIMVEVPDDTDEVDVHSALLENGIAGIDLSDTDPSVYSSVGAFLADNAWSPNA